jgi:GlpG protein
VVRTCSPLKQVRKIGSILSESDAARFSAYLVSLGIASQADEARDGTWEIWVQEDSQLAQGAAEFQRFLADPTNPRYVEGARAGAVKEQEELLAEKRSRSRIIDARSQWGIFKNPAIGQLTLILIGACVGVFVLENLDARPAVLRTLMFTNYESLEAGDPLRPIRHGEIWRLFTPVLLHSGVWHILFNMLWLRQLGSAIEYIEGTVNYGFQVLTYGVLGNILQYIVVGPQFLGMSGVVYGLFGYIWICARHDPGRAYVLDRQTVTLMIVWFALCFTGWIGPIANYAHSGGLLAGIIWASVTVRQIPFTKYRF